LHAALRQVLGEHVAQKGSLVDSQKLRFDFSNPEAIASEDLSAINQLVNDQIRANTAVQTDEMSMDEAVAAGAMALFGEKYGESVRVLAMGTYRFSVELCGGTHVDRTGDIGLMRITSEQGVAAGIRRIEAVTGIAALADISMTDETLSAACEVLKATPANLVDKVSALRQETRELEKQLTQLKQKIASASGGDLTRDAVEVEGIKVLAAALEGADAATLRDTLDQCKNKLGSAVVLLAATEGDKISLVAGVTADITDRIKAGDVIKTMSGRLGGKGGGRPDMAQGGGSDLGALPGVLADLPAYVAEQLTG